VNQPLPRRTALRTAAVLVAGSVGASSIAACAGSPDGTDGTDGADADQSDSPDGTGALVIAADQRAGVLDVTTSAHEQSLAATRALLDRAGVVVVASTDADVAAASTLARDLGLPVLVAGPGLVAELDRLQARTVVRLGKSSAQTGTASEGRTEVDGSDADAVADLPGLPLRPVAHGALVLLPPDAVLPAAVEATVAAAGADRITVHGSDPRLTPDAFEPLAAGTGPTLGVGVELGPAERLTQRVRTVRRATQLPEGGFLPFPGRRMIALYGHPDTGALGMLGEQPPADAVRRAQALADEYATLSTEPVIPAFELIASVASEAAGEDGTYSRRTPIEGLLPWVEAAEAAGIYVVLDLQPGRTDFLTQAEYYEPLLRRPFVGLALDPEWRLKPGQKHLRQIGSVDVDEVNRVGAWLAALVRPVARACRRTGPSGRQAVDVEEAQAGPARRGLARVEELRGRGPADAHAGSDDGAGEPDALVRVLPVRRAEHCADAGHSTTRSSPSGVTVPRRRGHAFVRAMKAAPSPGILANTP
jgi:hypothetical protein